MFGALLGPLDYMFGETLNMAVSVAIVLAALVALAARLNGWNFNHAARTWLWVTSLVTIWLFTQHSPYRGHGRVFELSPFNDLRAARYSESRLDLVLANIALFVPYGVAAAWRRYRFGRAVAIGFALSVAAETLQYIGGQGRIAQTSDVILNVVGAGIGWIAFAALRASLEGEGGVTGEVERGPGQDASRDGHEHGNAQRDRDRPGRT